MLKRLTQQTPQWPLRETSKIHSYARTRAFTMDDAEDHAMYREAIEYPVTNRWYIREVTQRPNIRKVEKDDPDIIEEGKTITSKTELTLARALEELAKFERGNLTAGLKPTGPDKNQIGAGHFEKVALDEEIALDIKGKAHPIISGRIVTDGQFSPSVKEKAMQVFQNGPSERPKAPVPALTGLFKSRAGVEDVERFLEHYKDINAWREFKKHVEGTLKILCTANKYGFDWRIMDDLHVDMGIKNTGHNKLFHKTIKNAYKTLKKISFLEDSHNRIMSDYLCQIEMAYCIGYAKADFMELHSCKDKKTGPQIQKQLNKHKDRAIQLCKSLGGTEQDLKTLTAEIFKDETPPMTLPLCYQNDDRDKPKIIQMNKLNDDQKSFYKKFKMFYGEKFDSLYSKANSAKIIYLPDILLEPLELINEIEAHLEKQAAQEKGRLSDQRKFPAKDSASEMQTASPSPS